MGLRSRLIFIVGIFSLLATMLIGLASYKITERHTLMEAEKKGRLLFDYIVSYRTYFMEYQKSLVMELVEEDRFYPELMSSFVTTRGIWDIFKGKNKGYHFKQASLDPLYQANKADAAENEMIQLFRKRPELKKQEGTLDKHGEKFYYMAYPIRVDNNECLRCHGDPLRAPKDQVAIYGQENGYNWKYGDTVSAFVVYVSIEEAMRGAKHSAGIIFLIGSGCFFLVVIAMGFFLDRHVVQPIEYLSDRTEEISQGINLGEKFIYEANDEIGVLARAIEQLRQIVVKTRKG